MVFYSFIVFIVFLFMNLMGVYVIVKVVYFSGVKLVRVVVDVYEEKFGGGFE